MQTSDRVLHLQARVPAQVLLDGIRDVHPLISSTACRRPTRREVLLRARRHIA